MLSSELCPFREVVLGARGIEFLSKLQEVALQLSLFRRSFGGRSRKAIVDIP